MTDPRQVSVSRVIAAPADKIFAVLADPAMHSVIDGSGTVRASRNGNPERLRTITGISPELITEIHHS